MKQTQGQNAFAAEPTSSTWSAVTSQGSELDDWLQAEQEILHAQKE